MSFEFADDLGPEKVIELYDTQAGLKAILAVDNTAAGPSIGGVRMAPDVSAEEAFRLARAMSFKNAAAGLAHGGGKAVIFADPAMPAGDKARLIRAFARAIREIEDYIPGPDMGTNEESMALVHDEIGRAVGLPREIGGIPLDEIGATGWGLAAAAEVAQRYAGVTLSGARVAVQGFGSVGTHAARFLAEKGAVLVAASDSRGMISDPDGLDVAALIRHKRSGKGVAEFASGTKDERDAIIDAACDVWIPAARPDVINSGNVDRLKARLVLQGANIPFTQESEKTLHERGVLIIPDFIANAGGVICGAVEYNRGTQSQALDIIAEKIPANTEEVLETSRRQSITPRAAANAMARERILRAMRFRRSA
jgi:glutamate dehydrogenase (NAD(P)+)